jgi:hypothetical protein
MPKASAQDIPSGKAQGCGMPTGNEFRSSDTDLNGQSGVFEAEVEVKAEDARNQTQDIELLQLVNSYFSFLRFAFSLLPSPL